MDDIKIKELFDFEDLGSIEEGNLDDLLESSYVLAVAGTTKLK